MCLLPEKLPVLHEVEEDGDPVQSGPPFSGPTFDLVRVEVPKPHVLEHGLQDPHVVHVQGTEINSNGNVTKLIQI